MSRINPPPRLLVGATLLFWGAMTGRPLVGLVMALLVESPQWLRWRWAFDDAAISRTWQLVLMLSFGLVALMLIDGEREQLMSIALTWMPALLLPLQLTQTFGLRTSMPLSALSFYASRRRERNKRLGIEEPEVRFHFGNVYFVVAILSSTLGVWAEARLFLPGILVLFAWRFLAIPKRRSTAIVLVFVCSGFIALLGQASLNRLYDWLSRGGHGGSSWMSDATHGHTAIGSMRDLKLSSEIRWRLRAEPGTKMPTLLRRAAFNRYRGTNWEISQAPQGGGADAQFVNLETIEPHPEEVYYLPNLQIEGTDAVSDSLARFTMRGATRPGGAIPLPGSVASFGDFDLDVAQRNPLSTVRIFPAAPVIDGVVLWNAANDPDGEPIWHDDLQLPPREAEMLQRVAASIGLQESMTPGEKMAQIKNWFNQEFRYSLYLSMRQPVHSIKEGTAIGRFLETTRNGHCEYFATSAVLLLRAANVPARYVTGYAAIERNARRNEYIIRGTHGHAWCRVWLSDQQRWIDFDPTPNDWSALEAVGKISWTQRVYDVVKRVREDIFIWRSNPKNREMLTIIIAIPAIFGGFWIAWKLWKSRHISRNSAVRKSRGTGQPSALLTLESAATRRLGVRPDGVPYAHWLLPLVDELGGSASTLNEAINLHQRLRYDPGFLDEQANRRLTTLTIELRSQIRNLGKRTRIS